MPVVASTYQPRTSSMDAVVGALLRPAWPYLESRRHRVWIRQLPNILTSLRLVLAVPVAVQLGNALQDRASALTIIWWIVAVVGLFASDGLDGTLSNRLRITSDYGRIFDPIADKVLVLSLLIVFVQAGSQLLPPAISIALATVVVVRVIVDIVLVIVTMLEVAQKRRPKAEKWGKRKLAADGLAALFLITGLWLASSHLGLSGVWIVSGGCAITSIAIYLGLRSIQSHLLNLHGAKKAA